eukprot:7904324-Pyramimonas_sp.AAC.1
MVSEVALHCNVRVMEMHACAFGDNTYLDPFSLLPVHLECLTQEIGALEGGGRCRGDHPHCSCEGKKECMSYCLPPSFYARVAAAFA